MMTLYYLVFTSKWQNRIDLLSHTVWWQSLRHWIPHLMRPFWGWQAAWQQTDTRYSESLIRFI